MWKFKFKINEESDSDTIPGNIRDKFDECFQRIGDYWIILNPMDIETLELKYQKYLSPKQYQASKPFSLVFTLKSEASDLEIEIEFSNMNQ